ncbi:MAG: hypothetical protein WCR07_06395 [Verrucomicrobiota bacterium]
MKVRMGVRRDGPVGMAVGMADKDVDTKEARGAGLPIRPVDENAANKLMRYVPYWA